MSEARSSMAIATTSNGCAVFLGGVNALPQASKAVDIWCAGTKVWTNSSMSFGRFAIAAVGHDTKVYIAGGGDETGSATDIIDILDVITMTWQQHHMSRSRYGLAVAIVGNSMVMFAGGGTPDCIDTIDLLDIKTMVVPPGPLLSDKRNNLAGASIAGRALFMGGETCLPKANSYQVDIYDPDDLHRDATTLVLLTPVTSPATVVVDGIIIVNNPTGLQSSLNMYGVGRLGHITIIGEAPSYPITLLPCPAATYAPRAGFSSCISCQAGDYSGVGQATCDSCPIGNICNNGTRLPCPAGFICPNERMTVGILCPNRYYCIEGNEVRLCPSGAFCPVGSAAPVPCPAGFSSPLNGTDVPVQLCQAGAYCPIGTIIPFNCTRGSYCPRYSSEPTICPLGTSCPNESMSKPLLCPAGTYGDQVGLIEPCKSCTAGTYQPLIEQVTLYTSFNTFGSVDSGRRCLFLCSFHRHH
jgi:hypothetical protein